MVRPACHSPSAVTVPEARAAARSLPSLEREPGWERGISGSAPWIERRARIAPDHVALIAGGQPVSYAELAARIRRLANGLRGLGVRHGDRVAWLGPNDPAFLESLFAAGLLGAALAPVNHRLERAERAFVLLDTEPTVLIEHSRWSRRRHRSSARHRDHRRRLAPGAARLRGAVTGSPDDPIDEAVGLDDLFMLPHTSGTTGRSQGGHAHPRQRDLERRQLPVVRRLPRATTSRSRSRRSSAWVARASTSSRSCSSAARSSCPTTRAPMRSCG